MKKSILALLLCLAMMLPLAACGGGTDTTTAENTPAAPVTPVDGYLQLTKDGATEFRMVIPVTWSHSEVKTQLDALKSRFFREAGVTMVLAFDNSKEGDREIVIGPTKRETSTTATEGMSGRDWNIKIVGDDIVIGATTLYSACLALDAFDKALVTYEGNIYIDSAFEAGYCYETDNTESVYGTLDEKRAQLADPTGRPMFVSHRAENVYSPENSRAAILSAVAAGADMIEVDIQKTFDGVYILCHDSTLSRTTNCENFIGKAGYPKTDSVSDWTYKQIQSLTLKDSAVNEPMVTLEEVFGMVKGRAILIFDKISSDADTKAIAEVAFKARALDSVMFQFADSFNTYKTVYEQSGIAMPFLHYLGSIADAANFVESDKYEEREYAIQAIQFPSITSGSPDRAAAARVNKKCRLYMNTLGNKGLAQDNAGSWNTLILCGVSIIQTDEIFNMAAFARKQLTGIGYEVKYTKAPALKGTICILTLNAKGGGDIYYTTDGSEPTAESEKYTKAIQIKESTTVRVFSNGNYLDIEIMAGSDEFYELVEAAKAAK